MSARIDWGYDAARLGAIGLTLIEDGSPVGLVSLTGQYMHEHDLGAVRSMDPVTCEYVTRDLGYSVLADALASALDAAGAGTYSVFFNAETGMYTIGASGVTSFLLTSLTTAAARMLGEPESTGSLEWMSTVPVWHYSRSAVGAWSEWSHRDADADSDTLTAADGSVRGLSPVGVASLLDFVAPWEPREAVRSDESGYSPREWTWQRAIARCRAIEPAVIVTADDVQRHVAYLRPDHVLRPRLAARDYLAHQSVPLAWHVVGELVADMSAITGSLSSTLSAPTLSSSGTVGALLDKIGVSAWGAWGFRVLRKAHTGALVRVRRASDSAEQDFGAASTGWLDTAALSSWLGSSDGWVKTLYDQSGNGRDMTAPSAARQPRIALAGTVDTKNGFPAMATAGATRRLSMTSGAAHGSSAFVTAAVGSFTSYAGNPRVASITSALPQDDWAGTDRVVAIQATTAPGVTSYRGSLGPVASAPSAGTLMSMWTRYDSGSVSASAVGGSETTGTMTTTALGSTVWMTAMCVAATAGDVGPLDGHLGELVHWSVALDSTQRATLYADQSAAWGV